MDSMNPEVMEVNNAHGQPKFSPEDETVSSYLEDRSEIYRDLVKVQVDVSNYTSLYSTAAFH